MSYLRLAHPALLVFPLIVVLMRREMTDLPATTVPWVSAVVALLAVADFVLAGLLERQVSREPAASRLRAKGKSPEQYMALCGMVLTTAPVCWALLASFFGLPPSQLTWYGIASCLGVAFWGWRYRNVIYGV